MAPFTVSSEQADFEFGVGRLIISSTNSGVTFQLMMRTMESGRIEIVGDSLVDAEVLRPFSAQYGMTLRRGRQKL